VSSDPQYKLDTKKGVELFERDIEDYRPNIVALDPISKFHTGEENDNTTVARLADTLDRFVARYKQENLSFILSHHFRKPQMGEGRVVDPLSPHNFRGAGRWFAEADTVTTFHRPEPPSDTVRGTPGWRVRSRWTLRHGPNLDNVTYWIHARGGFECRYCERESGEMRVEDVLG